MFRKTVLFSLFCIFIAIAVSILAWYTLPDLERYPVHWNAGGIADRFGTRGEVLLNLAIMPITSIFIAVMFYFIPKFEPMQKSMKASARPYALIWNAIMVLLAGISIMIARSYLNLSETEPTIASPRYIAFGVSAFFIFLGNISGKIRQNFMFGIRTPWTLSSELSWEKTQRIAGRLFVVNGITGLIAAIFLPEDFAILAIVGLVLATTVFCFIYSYRIWKNDPKKRQ